MCSFMHCYALVCHASKANRVHCNACMQAAINGLPKDQRPEVLVSASAVGTSQVLHPPACPIKPSPTLSCIQFAFIKITHANTKHILSLCRLLDVPLVDLQWCGVICMRLSADGHPATRSLGLLIARLLHHGHCKDSCTHCRSIAAVRHQQHCQCSLDIVLACVWTLLADWHVLQRSWHEHVHGHCLLIMSIFINPKQWIIGASHVIRTEHDKM